VLFTRTIDKKLDEICRKSNLVRLVVSEWMEEVKYLEK